MSHANASSRPPPKASPSRAAIVGTGRFAAIERRVSCLFSKLPYCVIDLKFSPVNIFLNGLLHTEFCVPFCL